MPFTSIQAELQVGDHVEFIDSNGSGDYRSVKGDKGIIREIDSGGLAMCDMTGQDGNTYTIGVMQRRLKKLASVAVPNFLAAPARTIVIPRADPKAYKVGDRVRMISRNPTHGRGEVNIGDIGTIIEMGSGGTIECRIDFGPAHRRWAASFIDIEHEFVGEEVELTIPDISLDEAVKLAKEVKEQIKELELKALAYERIMAAAGIKLI